MMATDHAEVTLNQISTALGITHGALYKYFANKQELWTAVASNWFEREIIGQLPLATSGDPRQTLHDWLWAFVNAKKAAYNTNPRMFTLNTQYVDQDPLALRRVLTGAYHQINQLLGRPTDDTTHAEAILATFATFALPTFKTTWNDADYQDRFEEIWRLIQAGV